MKLFYYVLLVFGAVFNVETGTAGQEAIIGDVSLKSSAAAQYESVTFETLAAFQIKVDFRGVSRVGEQLGNGNLPAGAAIVCTLGIALLIAGAVSKFRRV